MHLEGHPFCIVFARHTNVWAQSTPHLSWKGRTTSEVGERDWKLCFYLWLSFQGSYRIIYVVILCWSLLYYFAAIHTLLYSFSTGIMFYFCRQCIWTIPLPCGLSGLRGKKTETKIWEPIYDTDRSRRGRPNFKGRALSVRWTESANLDSQQEGVRGISAYL